MKKILIYGFENFSSYKENPSNNLVKQIISLNPIIQSIILPVADNAWTILEKEINKTKPELIIGFGMAPARSKVSVEIIAINKKHNQNLEDYSKLSENEPIIKNEYLALETNFNAKKLIEFLKKENIPADYSFNPGTFICNQVYYQLLNYIKIQKNIQCIFIHIPLEKEEIMQKDNKTITLPTLPTQPLAKAIVKYLEKYIK